ncbi:MAG: hypothetical protein M1821_004910 [Bathelium mastoideum]|nr:MAG: hypothetical protein M1821_004910 [Bathelium mastoideum]
MATTLEEVVRNINKQATALTRLSSHPPTFSESGAVDIWKSSENSSEAEASLLQSKNELINSAADLLKLAQGPVDQIINMAYSHIDLANLSTICKFHIPSKVPLDSTITLSDLSTATGLSPTILARIMRYAITNAIFTEPEPNVFAHSATSATLSKNQPLSDLAGFISRFVGSIVTSTADALYAQVNVTNGQLPPETGFNARYPGYVNLFDYMDKHPDEAQAYYNFLDGRSHISRYAIEKVCTAWDWAALGQATVVDIGGSSGHTAIALARAFPNLHCVVEDMNTAGLEMGRAELEKEEGLKTRVEFKQHDFFAPQPLQAEVYFFRQILHDWDDTNCEKIVRALEPALRDGARVLLSEGVMPQPPGQRTLLLEDRQIL